jgi:hypothetical protein
VLIHGGGDLTLELRRRAAWTWYPTDILLDSLDHTLIFSQQSGKPLGFRKTPKVLGGIGTLSLIWLGWRALKRGLPWQQLWIALATGLGAAGAQAGYVLSRQDQVTIISKAVTFSPLSIAVGAVVTAGGALITLRARRRIGRWIGLAIMTAASWPSLIFATLAITAVNLLSRSRIGTSLYNARLGLLSVPTFALTLMLSGLGVRLMARVTAARFGKRGYDPPASGVRSGRS